MRYDYEYRQVLNSTGRSVLREHQDRGVQIIGNNTVIQMFDRFISAVKTTVNRIVLEYETNCNRKVTACLQVHRVSKFFLLYLMH